MKMNLVVFVFAIAVATTAAAPAPTDGNSPEGQKAPIVVQPVPLTRHKRSHYNTPYMSPCSAAAASVPIPAIAPAAIPLNFAQMHGGYPVPHSYPYGVPHYRADNFEEEQEMMGFPEMNPMMMEHMPMARYGSYGAIPSAHMGGAGAQGLAGLSGIGAPVLAPTSSGPAYGLFPNAHVSGCNVPLLFSCSPSIVPGRIVNSEPHYNFGGAAAGMATAGAASVSGTDSYRGVDDHPPQETHQNHEEHTAHEHITNVNDATHAGAHQ